MCEIMINLSKKRIIKLTSILFVLLCFNSGSNTLSFDYSENKANISPNLDYYTTSPVEYFNETKHPRYNLVTKPIDLIVSPNKGRPVIVEFNEKECTYCGDCVEVCPRDIIKIDNRKIFAENATNCSLCNQCVETCETDAVFVSTTGKDFIFTIESTGALSIKEILRTALTILNNKGKEFKSFVEEF